MPKPNPIILTSLIIIQGIFIVFSMTPAYAQEAETGTLRQETTTTVVPEEDEVPSVVLTEDITPIGIVDEIILTGEIVTSQGAVIRQMTFKVGDEISARDIGLSRQRLLSLNGIYWEANITCEPAADEGHIIITVDLSPRRTWFISPSEVGGVVGDRNFLGSADTVSLGVFISDDDYFYNLMWMDPQFLGGHNSMLVEGHILDTNHSIRTDDIYSTGESYLIDRTGGYLNYRTRWGDDISVGVGYRFEEVDTEKFGDPFRNYGDEDTFFWSGTEIPDGNVGVLNFELSGGFMDSRYFPTQGYYWDFNNEVANSATLSDFSFTRHHVTAAYFQDIYEQRNVVCGRVMYSYLTGDPPNYELLPFDWQVRGYTESTHRGKSLFAANFEYRFIAEPDILQGVVFADFGRSWDDHGFGLDDLEFGYGLGLRLYTAPFVPYNLLFRFDYGWGEYGEEAMFGFNQFF